MTYEITTNEIV